MRNLILSLAILFVGCTSQATKDREKMEQLIKQEKQLNSQLLAVKAQIGEETEQYFPGKTENIFSDGYRDSMRVYDSMEGVVSKKYFGKLYDVEDSLKLVQGQIEELKLLMGK